MASFDEFYKSFKSDTKGKIFEKFVKNEVVKKEALPFKVPKKINLVMVDVETGLKPNSDTREVIYESFKEKDNFVVSFEMLSDKDRLGLYDSENQKITLRFY